MSYQNEKVNSNFKRIALIAGIAIAAIFTLVVISKSYVNVDSGEIVVVQHPFSGEFEVYTEPGAHAQYFGKVTSYRRSFQYWFDGKHEESKPIPVKFNDGGHADIPGSIRVDLPLDKPSMIKLHRKYGTQSAIEEQLVGQTLAKSIYLAGPTMSSKEAYAEKKNDLLYYVEDQAKHGIYKTAQKDIETLDPLTNQKRTVTVVDIAKDSSGNPARIESSAVTDMNVTLSNLSFGDFGWDDVVKKQIATQQQATMQVQTAIAHAKEAEQQAITTEQQGKANAADAKWKQETIKAQAVTEAEQNLAVARLNAQTEDANKNALILKGQGEAAYKAAVTQANNNFDAKLEAWKFAQEKWADAFAKYSGAIVPVWQTGGTGNGSGNGATQFMDLMTANAAKQLGLDVTPGGAKK